MKFSSVVRFLFLPLNFIVISKLLVDHTIEVFIMRPFSQQIWVNSLIGIHEDSHHILIFPRRFKEPSPRLRALIDEKA